LEGVIDGVLAHITRNSLPHNILKAPSTSAVVVIKRRRNQQDDARSVETSYTSEDGTTAGITNLLEVEVIEATSQALIVHQVVTGDIRVSKCHLCLRRNGTHWFSHKWLLGYEWYNQAHLQSVVSPSPSGKHHRESMDTTALRRRQSHSTLNSLVADNWGSEDLLLTVEASSPKHEKSAHTKCGHHILHFTNRFHRHPAGSTNYRLMGNEEGRRTRDGKNTGIPCYNLNQDVEQKGAKEYLPDHAPPVVLFL